MPIEPMPPRLTKAAPAPGDWRHLRIALWIFLTFSVFYIGLTRGRFISTDEIDVYQATQSLWERGTAAIQSPEGTPGRAGQLFPVRNSGLSVAALPLYGFGKAVESVLRHCGREDWVKTFSGPVIERAGGDRWSGEPGIFFVNLFNCFVTALLCALFYCFSLQIGASTNWALLSTALLGLTSYIAPLSAGFFQHSSEALFLLAAFYFLFLDGQRADWRWRLLAGAMTALLLQFRFPAIVAVPGLLLYHCALVWRRRPEGAHGVAGLPAMLRQIAPFTGALAIGLILHAADQFAKFGTIRSVGPYATLGFHNPLLVGLYGFLFSPGDSIFLFTPLLVLLPWTLRHLYRSFRTEMIFIVMQTSVYLIFYGKFDTWHGLWCFGPRYLAAVVPLLMLPLGPWLETRGRNHWLILAPLALLGLWMQMIHFAVDFWNVILQENYLTFQPANGFLFNPAASQIVAHSRALLAWDWRVDMWLVTVYRTFGAGRFMLLFLPLAALLAGCLWKLRQSLRALGPVNATAPDRRVMNPPMMAARVLNDDAVPPRGANTRRFQWLGAALLLAALLAVYSNHFHNSFHFDDAHTIENNAAIQELRNIPQFFRDATTFSSLPSNQSYRPLVSTLLAIDYRLAGGLQPFWFHLSIFALFVAIVVLLAFVVHRLLDQTASSMRDRWIALAAAAWYGLHPANADTVNYIIASSEVISTLGVIAAFAVYFAFPQLRRYYLYVLPAAIAILAKPTAAIFAVLFAIYWLLFEQGKTRLARLRSPRRPTAWQAETRLQRIGEIIAPFVICLAMLLFVQHMTPRSWVAGAANAHNYLMTQPYVTLLYFKTFFWPAGLSADYDLNSFTTTDDPHFWAGFAFIFLFTVCAVALSVFRKTRVIGFGLFWFLIALLPTSLFPLAEVMNDHRTFLPYVGLVIAMAGAAALLVALSADDPHPTLSLRERRTAQPPGEGYRQPSWTKIVVICLVVLFLCANGYATFQRNKVWKSEETLWYDVTLKSPRNGRGLMNYGNTLMAKGDYAGALDYFHRAQQFVPQYSVLFINLAIVEDATKQSAAAEQHFKEALRLAPASPDSYIYYARYLISHSRAQEARAFLQSALELSPTDLTARGLLAQTDGQANNQSALQTPESYLAFGLRLYGDARYIESIAASRRALELRPDYAEAWNNIGAAYNQLGRYEEAAAACEQALRYQPDFELARNNLQYAKQRLAAMHSK